MQFDSFWRELKPRLNRSSVVNDKSADACWGRLVYMLLYLASATRCEWSCQWNCCTMLVSKALSSSMNVVVRLFDRIRDFPLLRRRQNVWKSIRAQLIETTRQLKQTWRGEREKLTRDAATKVNFRRFPNDFGDFDLEASELIESEVVGESLNSQLLERVYCSIKSEIVKPFYRQFRFYRWRTLAQQKTRLKGKRKNSLDDSCAGLERYRIAWVDERRAQFSFLCNFLKRLKFLFQDSIE